MKRLIAIVVIGLVFSFAEAAQLVVIASNSSSFKPGQMIDGSATLFLEQGGVLTLVSQQGKTLKLQGPYEGQPAPEKGDSTDSVLDSLSRIISESEQSAALAVFRSTSKKRSPWTINISKAGQYCVSTQDKLTLRRPKPLTSGVLEITDDGTRQTTLVSWNEGDRTVLWPIDLKIKDHARYQLSFPGQAPVQISLRVLPGDLATNMHKIVWMSDQGCTKQANKLLKDL